MKKEIIGKYFAILGLLLFWPLFWAIADIVLAMVSSFQEITLYGTNEPKITSEEMLSTAEFIAIGGVLSMLGLILLAFSVVWLNYRTRWFFWALAIHSSILLSIIPIGTLVGLVVLTVLILNREKFGPVNHVT